MTDNVPPIISEWLTHLDLEGKSANTRKGYRRGLLHFAAWYKQSGGEPFDPAAVIARDVRDWVAFQQTVEGSKPATINQRLAALSGFYRWAIQQKRVSHNPTRGIKALRREPRRPRALPQKELRRLRRYIHANGNLRDIALFEMLAGAGLRVTETLALKVSDVTINDRSGKVVIRRGKGHVYREIPLTKEVRQVLREYLAAHPALEGEDPLWVGQRGPLKDPSSINRLLDKYARFADVEEVTPHILRHSFATGYLKAHPGDIRHLAAILGHADLKTTMVYTEPDLDELTRRMEEAEVKVSA
ncbi:MAG: tyrosine-type recombinase/integrase [Chloroflexi bacterium]|nr:tyrosine-type recombinase/integrase [Chloroflexota bacterium]